MTNLKLKEGQRLPQHPQVESDRARAKARSSVVSLVLPASFSPSSPQCSAWHTVDTLANTSCVTKAGMEAAHSVYAPDPPSSNGRAPNLGLDKAEDSTHLNRK